jgi:AraC-like DNA-binding protein
MSPDAIRNAGGVSPIAAPTLTASTVRAVLDALARLGHDVPALLQAVGLGASTLEDPDARISCQTVGAIYAHAQARRRIADLDLQLAIHTPLGAYPLLDYLVATSSTVAEGLKRFADHAQLTGAPVRAEIHDEQDPIRVVIDASPYSVYLGVLHLRREAEGVFRPELVCLKERPDDVTAVEQAIGCPVHGDAAWSGLVLSREMWNLPLRRRDAVLAGVLERHARDVASRLPGGNDIVSELRRVLARRISRGDARIATVAGELRMSARSLQRRLAEAHVSYQELVHQARCDAAERHLTETALSIAEVSWLVGYSEPSAFHRAFKRWRGLSPRSYREQKLGGQAG